MALPTELKPFNNHEEDFTRNDSQLFYYAGLLISRGALAVKSISFTSGTPDQRYNIWLAGGGFTLPQANYWGVGRSPIVLTRNTTAGAITITAAAGDTIEGAASYSLAANTSAILFNDGNTKWYIK